MDNIVKELTDKDFKEFIKNQTKPVMVDFWATWCGPCRMQAPILYEIASELKEKAVFCKVDVDENESLAYEYKIASIPCIIVFKDGRPVEKTVGLATKAELAEMLIKYI